MFKLAMRRALAKARLAFAAAMAWEKLPALAALEAAAAAARGLATSVGEQAPGGAASAAASSAATCAAVTPPGGGSTFFWQCRSALVGAGRGVVGVLRGGASTELVHHGAAPV